LEIDLFSAREDETGQVGSISHLGYVALTGIGAPGGPRFPGRILSVGDIVPRRWRGSTGTMKKETGHPPPMIDTLSAGAAALRRQFLPARRLA